MDEEELKKKKKIKKGMDLLSKVCSGLIVIFIIMIIQEVLKGFI